MLLIWNRICLKQEISKAVLTGPLYTQWGSLPEQKTKLSLFFLFQKHLLCIFSRSLLLIGKRKNQEFWNNNAPIQIVFLDAFKN